jgi:hypothetical protein
MHVRTYDNGETASEAVYSPCESYRYSLTRVWDPSASRLTFVMLNPSKADERKNDPTVERCERRARLWEHGAFRVVNLFAWRDTDPANLRRAESPVGPSNDRFLRDAVGWADQTVLAWGVHGAHLGRSEKVAGLIEKVGKPLYHLGLTKDGHPRHPLYVPYSQQPILWN